jgi:hypothetical protein
VERVLAQCWSVDAATYLRCVWKWHVAFFDRHEATSSGEHLATIATRLRRNHSTLAQQVLPDPHDITSVRLRRGICQLLGGKGEQTAGAREAAKKCVLVFYAGRATDDDSAGAAGVMIVETWTSTRRFRVLYMRGVHPEGSFRNGEAAAQIGLLHGLRSANDGGGTRSTWSGIMPRRTDNLALGQLPRRSHSRRRFGRPGGQQMRSGLPRGGFIHANGIGPPEA